MTESDPTKRVDDLPIGIDRYLTVEEQLDIDLIGLPREELAGMTPKEIKELADSIADSSNLFLGA